MAALGNIFGPGRKIDKLLKKAEESFGHGEWDQCALASEETLSLIDPLNPGKYNNELLRAYYLDAAALYKSGKIEKSLGTLREGMKQPDGVGDIAKLLSEVAEKTAVPEVVELLEDAVKKLPNNNQIAFALCNKYYKLEKFDEKSLPIFTKMQQRAPDNKIINYCLAMCYRKLGKYDRTTLAVYRRAFHEFSTNMDFLYGLARTYAGQKTIITEALPVIERALKFFPDEELFQQAKVTILVNMPNLAQDQVRILLDTFKKTKDLDLAEKLVNHLLSTHADGEDACRVYEAVWKDHAKKTTLLSILSERYRLAGRNDKDALEVFQTFFDEMPREQENTLNLARRYAEKNVISEHAVLVYQQALRDGVSTDVNAVVLALANAYMNTNNVSEEAGRIYRMAHNVEPDNYDILKALKDVVMTGGRLDGSRANAMIDYVNHPETSEKQKKEVAVKLGAALAVEGRSDDEALKIYRMNFDNRAISEAEENILATLLVGKNSAKVIDINLLEKVFDRLGTDEMALKLARLYLETNLLSENRLPVMLRAAKLTPSDKQIGSWLLTYLFNNHGNDEKIFPQLTELVINGHLAGATGINQGVVAQTITRIARDKIRDGNFAEAISILIEAFKVEKNPILQYLLGVSYQGSGDTSTGLGIFKDLLKGDKTNPAYSYRIAVLNLIDGKLDEAEAELQQLAKLFSDHPMLSVRLGMIEETRGNIDKAYDEYRKVKSGDKSIIAFADYRKGIIKASRGEWEDANKLLNGAFDGGVSNDTLNIGLLVSTLKLIDKEISIGSTESGERLVPMLAEYRKPPWLQVANERYLRLGLLALVKNDFESAYRILSAADKTGIRDARISSLLAMVDIEAGRPKASVERLEKVLGIRESSGAELAHRMWAIISLKLGKHDEAREAAEWLLAHNSKDAVRIRFLCLWRNPLEVDWPPALDEYSYDYLEREFKFPVGLIGRLAYKCADYEGGAKYLEKYFKDKNKPDHVEAEFLLGLMYIKQKKPNLGLHYWGNILDEGYKELEGKQRIDGLVLLGYHFLEHGEPEKSREAFKLALDAGASTENIDHAISLSHIQAGYLAAKSDNLRGAIREWEKILESNPDNWQALQNLGLAYFWTGYDDKSLEYFNRLFVICDSKPELIDEDDYSFVSEETRKMINQLVSLVQSEKTRSDVKHEMLLDEIQSANRHYWTLGVKKGISSQSAQANYFRLVKIYNPEKYPQDFMVLEKAYDFFNKPGLLKKNEQKVFNAFHFRMLGMEETEGLSEIPPSAQVVEFLMNELKPGNNVDFQGLLEDSLKRVEKIPEISTAPDYSTPDYLASW
ncbi:MAG: tetratricopeptide repeat protein [bacterium]|nr:tetratricopeptide repeat protein [bacterium]